MVIYVKVVYMFINAANKLFSIITASPEVSQIPEKVGGGPNQYIMLGIAVVLLAIWLFVLRFKKAK